MAILKSTQIKGDLSVTGSLNVQGDLTYVGVENLRVKDKQIELNTDDKGLVVASGQDADEAGIVIKGTTKGGSPEASILYNYANDSLVINKTIEGTVSNATTAASANKVANKLTVNVKKKGDSGEETESVVFDGSAAETVNIDLKALQDQIDGMSGATGSVATQINNAINNLDVADAAVVGQYVSSVSETDGKISVTRVDLPNYDNTYDAKGAAAAVKTELIGQDNDTKDSATIKGAKKYADDLATKKADTVHTHAIADVTDLQAALDGKAAKSHTHAIANVTGLQAALDAKQNKLSETQLAAVNSGITADKVTSYSNHIANGDIHVTADDKAKWNAAEQNAIKHANGLNTAMNARVEVLEAIDHNALAASASAAAVAKVVDGAPESFDTLKEVAAWIADNSHAATVAELVTDVNDLKKIDHDAYKAADETVLASAKTYADGLAKNYAAAKHSHAIADVTGLDTALAGKAAVDHNHDDVYSKLNHTHVVADVTDLQAALDAKQNKLDGAQLRAVNSGITSTTVATYDAHVADTTKHITDTERKAWNAAEQNAKTYADGLAKNYDAAGAAATVKSEVIGSDQTDTKESDTIKGAKKYADAAVSALSSSVAATDAAQNTEIDTIKSNITSIQGNYVRKAGDTMTGKLTMSAADIEMSNNGVNGIVFGNMKIVWKDNAIEFIPTTA